MPRKSTSLSDISCFHEILGMKINACKLSVNRHAQGSLKHLIEYCVMSRNVNSGEFQSKT